MAKLLNNPSAEDAEPTAVDGEQIRVRAAAVGRRLKFNEYA